jgi:CIC family chloride channel protein
MFKKYLSKLEAIIAWSQSIEKQFIFLSSILVGITSAFAVIDFGIYFLLHTSTEY